LIVYQQSSSKFILKYHHLLTFLLF